MGEKLCFPGEAVLGVLNPVPHLNLAVLALLNLIELSSCSSLSRSMSAVAYLLVSVSGAPLWIIFSPNSPANTQPDASTERLKGPLGVLGSFWEQSAPGQPGQLSSLSCQLQLSCRRQWEGFNSRWE